MKMAKTNEGDVFKMKVVEEKEMRGEKKRFSRPRGNEITC